MELVFATHNSHKFKEVQLLLPQHIQLLGLEEIGCVEDIPEPGITLEENAIYKARYVKEKYGYACFADDTGLEVASLDHAPGVYSARYAGPQKNTDDNIRKLLEALRYITDRKARFKTVIALISEDKTMVFEGIVKGVITKEKYGGSGFGYDPVFLPEGYTKTFGELPILVKNQISHRAKAINQLVNYLK